MNPGQAVSPSVDPSLGPHHTVRDRVMQTVEKTENGHGVTAELDGP